ncbi:MAG: Rieske 2Fe-2S domain-containing protein [Dehalococcoidia bacterium]|nr:MAG: Rieske 2Fe-2S domain-containing protein [Dehalococcoidia bacterium]
MKEIPVMDFKILLAQSKDKYYAADSRCPHLGGKLANGTLEGTIVTCPLHGSQFDLSDGRVVRWLKGSGIISKMGRALKSPRSLRTYEVKIDNDKILIALDSD